MQLPIPNPENLSSDSELEEAHREVMRLNAESHERMLAAIDAAAGDQDAISAIRVEQAGEGSQCLDFVDYWRGVREFLGLVPGPVEIRSIDG